MLNIFKLHLFKIILFLEIVKRIMGQTTADFPNYFNFPSIYDNFQLMFTYIYNINFEFFLTISPFIENLAFYLDNNNNKVFCDLYCYNCNQSGCISCSSGYYLIQKNKTCVQCPTNCYDCYSDSNWLFFINKYLFIFFFIIITKTFLQLFIII